MPKRGIPRGVPLDTMIHEPLGFVGGAFRGSQFNWSVVDQEKYAMVATLKRLNYLVWAEIKVLCGNRNLVYVLNPQAWACVMKATTQGLAHWRTFFNQFPIEIV